MKRELTHEEKPGQEAKNLGSEIKNYLLKQIDFFTI